MGASRWFFTTSVSDFVLGGDVRGSAETGFRLPICGVSVGVSGVTGGSAVTAVGSSKAVGGFIEPVVVRTRKRAVTTPSISIPPTPATMAMPIAVPSRAPFRGSTGRGAIAGPAAKPNGVPHWGQACT